VGAKPSHIRLLPYHIPLSRPELFHIPHPDHIHILLPTPASMPIRPGPHTIPYPSPHPDDLCPSIATTSHMSIASDHTTTRPHTDDSIRFRSISGPTTTTHRRRCSTTYDWAKNPSDLLRPFPDHYFLTDRNHKFLPFPHIPYRGPNLILGPTFPEPNFPDPLNPTQHLGPFQIHNPLYNPIFGRPFFPFPQHWGWPSFLGLGLLSSFPTRVFPIPTNKTFQAKPRAFWAIWAQASQPFFFQGPAKIQPSFWAIPRASNLGPKNLGQHKAPQANIVFSAIFFPPKGGTGFSISTGAIFSKGSFKFWVPRAISSNFFLNPQFISIFPGILG